MNLDDEINPLVNTMNKKFSNNYHQNRYDMNIQYNIRKLINAKIINNYQTFRKKNFEDRVDFNMKIRNGDEGRLDILQLKKLNSVKKRDYIKMVIEESDKMVNYLDYINKKTEEKQNELCDMMMGIEDTNDTWNQAVDHLNHKILEAAERIGVNH